MSQKTIGVMAGSARQGSYNKMLARAAAQYLKEAGANVVEIDLADYRAPVYNGDDEAESGMPETMQKLKAQFMALDAFVIATPEYNGFVPAVLVNSFNWTSRLTSEGESMNGAFSGKPVAIMAASPGGLGGIRVIPRLRDMLAELGMMAVPGFVTVPSAYEAFDEAGGLKSERTAGQLKGVLDTLMAKLVED